MYTVASEGTTMGISQRAQEADGLRKSSLGLTVRELGKVIPPLYGQRESVTAEVRVTLQGQVLARGQDRALVGQWGWLPNHICREYE
jgi:hypothetical protein